MRRRNPLQSATEDGCWFRRCSMVQRKCCCAPMTDPRRMIRSQPIIALQNPHDHIM